MKKIYYLSAIAFGVVVMLHAEIPKPTDAPKPLPPAESLKQFKLPPGYRLELLASEPLIREPSGVCWDEKGRLYVSEMHGYNLEGQLDIDELNKTGELDHQVRRLAASEKIVQAARAGTYGTIKLLTDTNGDGIMDKVQIFADHLPPVYGMCAARGGLIVACAPDVMFLADRDGDGKAEVRETLFTGFAVGSMERGINQPQWGLDNWIYIGRGHGGGKIIGPGLTSPIYIANTDFRLKADGSAIEAITGATRTYGHTFTADGERFVVQTTGAGMYVTPLPWIYLARNPDAAAPRADQPAAEYRLAYPISTAHPWRSKRADDPGFAKYYTDHYGVAESAANGYFTSICGPLVYQDVALPPEVRGQFFSCEPAQNFITHAIIERDGTMLNLHRAPGWEKKEFLASSDQWFHPIALSHAPDGAIAIVDMYREIIEDYSAVPRYLQQQYGLTNGIAHGRIWRLTHKDAPAAPSPDMSGLDNPKLAKEVGSPHFWRRETARRLLVERKAKEVAPALSQLARESKDTAVALNALYTLDGLGALTADDAAAALKNSNPAVQRHGLRFAERWLDTPPVLFDQAAALAGEKDAALLLQLALTLGESKDARVLPALAALARAHGDIQWMPNAILSSLYQHGGDMLDELLRTPENLAEAKSLINPLCAAISARRDQRELAQALARIAAVPDAGLQTNCLRGLQAGLKGARAVRLAADGHLAVNQLMAEENPEVRRLARQLHALFQASDPATQQALLAEAARNVANVKLPAETRLAAVAQLASSEEPNVTAALLAAWPVNTPKVRDAILEAIFSRRDRLPALLNAVEKKNIPPSALSAFQRLTLLENDQPAIRERSAKLFTKPAGASDETFRRYAAALTGPRDKPHGEKIFREICATCHQTRGIGAAVGPDLGAEFQRAEEAILKDILAPNETISAGFPTYVIETAGGQTLNGILASESATSVTLRMPTGLEQVILRKDIVSFSSLPVSLMPEGLTLSMEPQDVADVIAWLRDSGGQKAPAPNSVVLFDDETEFPARLFEGNGRATFEMAGAYSGTGCLAVTPFQRHSRAIPGWNYRIAEKPGPGEFRYLRLAWKTRGGDGVMLELAAGGKWPDAESSQRRYYAGKNTTEWKAREVSPEAPREWRVVTLDLWKDGGAFTLTGIAPTTFGGTGYFDKIELLRDLRPAATAKAAP